MRQFVRVLGLSTVLSCLSLPGIATADIFGAAAGTGPMPAVAEQLASLPRHTLYRPQQLPKSPLPIFLWGNGACRDNGLAHGAFLRQIASQGYLVIALGVPREERPFDPNPAPPPPAVAPGQPEPRNVPDETQAAQLLEALDWATRENSRAGSPLQGHLDVAKVAVGGHSCGGLQAISVSDDPRIRTTLVLNSGVYVRASGGRSGVQVGKEKLATLHGPMLYLTGGPEDIAHVNASDDVARIDHLPVFMGSIPVGHGGTFWTQRDGGDWARVAARWLDWQLKQDADASWDFAGPECRLCRNPRWTVVQKKLGLPKGPFRKSRYVPVRDGTKLAVNVYHPAAEGRVSTARLPVVFSYTPYRARFRTPELRRANAEAMRDELGAVLARQPAAHWEAVLSDAGIPCGMVREVGEAVSMPHGVDRGLTLPLTVPGLPDGKDEVAIVNAGFRMSAEGPGTTLPPPRLDEHGDRIRAWLDATD